MSNNQKKALVFIIVFGIIIFALGVGAGIWYSFKNPKVENAEKIQPTINALNSKVIQTATAFGRVVKVVANKITLSNEGDTLEIAVRPDAQIYSAISVKDPKSGNIISGVPKPVSLADIKTNDAITITFKLDASGNLEGEQVFIFVSGN